MKENETAKVSNDILLEYYLEWSKNLDVELLKDAFSNPYYIKTPSDWWEKKYRIMIVGEEGAGGWGAGKTKWNPQTKDGIEKIMEYNSTQTYVQTVKRGEYWFGGEKYVLNNGQFWNRIRKICDLSEDVTVVWNNIDKIHRLGNKGTKCKLTDKQRMLLHKERILSKEIEILQPTIVVFFGWHWRSLECELPNIYDMVYQKYLENGSVPFRIEKNIFSLHPNAKKIGRTKAYGKKVLEQVKTLLTN